MTASPVHAPARHLRFVVYGTPAPQGSKRHVGGGRMIESSRKVKPWREDVKAAAERLLEVHAVRPPPIDAPIRIRLVFTLPKPASAPKRRVTYPRRKPDIDKLIRSTFDALTSAGMWIDDSCAIEVQALKVFPGEHPESLASPGVRVELWEVV